MGFGLWKRLGEWKNTRNMKFYKSPFSFFRPENHVFLLWKPDADPADHQTRSENQHKSSDVDWRWFEVANTSTLGVTLKKNHFSNSSILDFSKGKSDVLESRCPTTTPTTTQLFL